MKRFSAIISTVCLLGTVYGIQYPIRPYDQWATETQNSLNPELASLITNLNAVAATKSPAKEIFKFPDALNEISVVLTSFVDDVEQFLRITTHYAKNPVGASIPYFDFPRNQIQPYLAIFPALTSQLNEILVNKNKLVNILDNQLYPVAIKEKVNGNVIALPRNDAIQVLHQLSAGVQKIVDLLQTASAQSIKAEGPTVGIMTFINGGITRAIPQIHLIAVGIEKSTDAIKYGKPNAHGLVNVDFGNAVKTLNGYIVQVTQSLGYFENTVDTVAFLLNLAESLQLSQS